MQNLIDVIRVAVSSGATSEQKSAGAHACRTLLAALDTEPGKPIVLPGSPPLSAPPRLSMDQVLELAIARLTTIVSQRNDAAAGDANQAPVAAPPPAAPQGLRVPGMPAPVPRAVPRPAAKPAARPAPAVGNAAKPSTGKP